MGADIETLLGNCLNLSNPLDNQQNQRKVDRAKKEKKTPQYDILLAPAAAWAPSGFIYEAINPINRSTDQPIERAKNVACQIFKYKYNNNSWTTNNNNNSNNSIGEKQW